MLDFQKTKTFADFVENAAARYGSQPALVWRPSYRKEVFSYADLLQLSRVIAHQLQERGVNKGQHVVMWANNSPWWVATFFACQLLGAVVIPLGPRNTRAFVKRITERTEAFLLIKDGSLLTADKTTPMVTLQELSANWKTKPADFERAESGPDDIAELLFTSGTTGDPKGVELRHKNILSNVEALTKLNIINSNDRQLSFLPLSHIFEQVAGLFAPLSYGIQITQAARISSQHLRINMQEDHPTIMTSVPDFMRLVLKRVKDTAHEEGSTKKLEFLFKVAPKLPIKLRRVLAKSVLASLGGKLKTVVSGGAAMDPEVGRAWESFGIKVLQGYGTTETSPVIAANSLKDRKMSSVGKPLPGVEVRIEKGEIVVRGPNVVRGYFNDPQKTAEVFKDGWYYTGDAGFIDEDDHIHIKGRKKYMVVRPTGENVFPEELEAALNNQPEIQDSAVIGRQTDDRFELHAVLLPEQSVEIDPRKLLERVNANFEPHQRMDAVSLWDQADFPRSATNKVKKEQVSKWLDEQEAGRPVAKRMTGGELEHILSTVTGRPPEEIVDGATLVGDLNMDSLQRITFVAAVEESLSLALDEAAITPTITVADIREWIRTKKQKKEKYDFVTWPLSGWVRALRWAAQWLLLWPVMFTVSRVKVQGRANVSEHAKTPVLFFVNHASGIDAGFVLRALPAKIRSRTAIAAAIDTLWEDKKISRWRKFLQLSANIFPFARVGQIKSSFEYAGRLIDRGYSVMFFPAGKVSKTGEPQEFKQGTGLVTLEMAVQVVPVAVVGSQEVLPYGKQMLHWGGHRHTVEVVFGKPKTFKAGTSVGDITDQVQKDVKTLFDQATKQRASHQTRAESH